MTEPQPFVEQFQAVLDKYAGQDLVVTNSFGAKVDLLDDLIAVIEGNSTRHVLTFDMSLEAESGVTVPVSVTMAYPADMGLYATQSLDHMATAKQEVLRELINRGDSSVLMALAKQ